MTSKMEDYIARTATTEWKPLTENGMDIIPAEVEILMK